MACLVLIHFLTYTIGYGFPLLFGLLVSSFISTSLSTLADFPLVGPLVPLEGF